MCASCCARVESSQGRLRCRWLGSRSGVAMTHVRLRRPAMHRDQQLEQEVGLAKCNRVLPLTMCLLNFVVPASCSLSLLSSQVAQVVNLLSSFLPLPVCVRCWILCLSFALTSQFVTQDHRSRSFSLLTVVGSSRFFCGTHLHRHMIPFLCVQFPCSRFCSLCARSFREFFCSRCVRSFREFV